MPPNSGLATGVLYEGDSLGKDLNSQNGEAKDRQWLPHWEHIIFFSCLHPAALYGLYLSITAATWKTLLFTLFLYIASGLGVTAGAHRLWTHKAYSAKLPLKILLIVFNSLAFEGSVTEWSMDHRIHHKYAETDADPHNATRGFFFSHIGWLLVKKHPDCDKKMKNIDFSDLLNDEILRFQHKYYLPLAITTCFVIPGLTANFMWGEDLVTAVFVTSAMRAMLFLHATWLVNSAAHMYGTKPYDRHIGPVETIPVSIMAVGEGFHNYHHAFPWDYKAAELGIYSLNITTLFLDIMAKIGWAYDLKYVSDEIIKNRVKRTGDGSHHLWGWGDKDQCKEEVDLVNNLIRRNK